MQIATVLRHYSCTLQQVGTDVVWALGHKAIQVWDGEFAISVDGVSREQSWCNMVAASLPAAYPPY